MLLVQKFKATVTDENRPSVTVSKDFSDDSIKTYTSVLLNLEPYDVELYENWKSVTETEILSVPLATKYLVISTDKPIYIWINKQPVRTDGKIDETISPKIEVSGTLILKGGIKSIYALNPCPNDAADPRIAHLDILYCC